MKIWTTNSLYQPKKCRELPGVFAGLVAAQLIRIELTEYVLWSFAASMGRQELPDVNSEQDDNLDEQARFRKEMAASIVGMRERRNNSFRGPERIRRRLSFL